MRRRRQEEDDRRQGATGAAGPGSRGEPGAEGGYHVRIVAHAVPGFAGAVRLGRLMETISPGSRAQITRYERGTGILWLRCPDPPAIGAALLRLRPAWRLAGCDPREVPAPGPTVFVRRAAPDDRLQGTGEPAPPAATRERLIAAICAGESALADGTEDQTPVAAAVRRCWDALAALEALAQEVDRWWYAPDADGGSFDLAEGVRLHRAVETHLGQLEAV